MTEFITKRQLDTQKIHGRPTALSAASEVLILLLYLKHYPVDLFLAIIYTVSKQTLRNFD